MQDFFIIPVINSWFVLRILCAFGLVLAAFIYDIRTYRIPNQLIIIGLGLSIIFVIIDLINRISLRSICILGGICIVLFFICYLVGAIGAGDSKLLMVLSILTPVYVQFHFLIVLPVVSFILCSIVLFINKNVRIINITEEKYVKVHTFHYSSAIIVSQICACVFVAVKCSKAIS